MWNKYKVNMRFSNRVCGSVPMSKELVPIWLKSRMPKKEPDNSRPMEEIEKEVMDSIDETLEKTTLGFQKNKDGVLFVRGGTIKAHLKDCANQVKDAVPNPAPKKGEPKVGIKAFRAKIANKVYIEEYAVIFVKDGKPVTESDGTYEQPIHVWAPQGQNNALKVINYLEKPAELIFTLMLLEDKLITIDVVRDIFSYGSVHGYGGERGLGEGRYSFTIEDVA